MRALLTANYSSEHVEQLLRFMELHRKGFATGGQLLDQEELVRELSGIDVFIVGYDQVTRKVLREATDLKVIASIRGGPEANIDIDAATEAGIPVLYAVGRTRHAVAEYAILFMLLLARPLCKANDQVRNGTLLRRGRSYWQEQAGSGQTETLPADVVWPLEPGTPIYKAHHALFGTELYGKTVGVVGFGNIGQTVAGIAQALGMKVLVHDPFVERERPPVGDVEFTDLPSLMSRADYVTLHARLDTSSMKLIGRSELRAMKPSACLINTARAALVDEQALIDALNGGWIRAAGLDVYHREPLEPDHPLLKIDRNKLLLSPHLGGSTVEVELHHCEILNSAILQYLRGTRPVAIRNPEVFASPSFVERGGLLYGLAKDA